MECPLHRAQYIECTHRLYELCRGWGWKKGTGWCIYGGGGGKKWTGWCIEWEGCGRRGRDGVYAQQVGLLVYDHMRSIDSHVCVRMYPVLCMLCSHPVLCMLSSHPVLCMLSSHPVLCMLAHTQCYVCLAHAQCYVCLAHTQCYVCL